MHQLSVVVTAYNHRPFIRECVESLLSEAVSGLQVIVVDDGSDDGTANEICDLPVQLIRNPTNRGIAFSRNRGLEMATGEYLTFFDSDNVLLKGGLFERLEWLKAHPEEEAVGGVVGGAIDPDGKLVPDRGAIIPPARLSLEFFRQGGVYSCASWLYLFRRRVLPSRPFDESLRVADDCELLLRLLAQISIPIIRSPISLYRLHASNVSLIWSDHQLRMPPRAAAETLLVFMSHGLSKALE